MEKVYHAGVDADVDESECAGTCEGIDVHVAVHVDVCGVCVDVVVLQLKT